MFWSVQLRSVHNSNQAWLAILSADFSTVYDPLNVPVEDLCPTFLLYLMLYIFIIIYEGSEIDSVKLYLSAPEKAAGVWSSSQCRPPFTSPTAM